MRRSRRRRPTSHRRRPRSSLKSSRNITKFRPGYHRTAGLWRTARQRAKEIKYFDRTIEPAVDIIDVPGDATSLITLIPQGNGRSARIGQKITVVGLELRIRLVHAPPNGGTGEANIIRFQIWLDTQANGTQAVIDDFLELVTGAAVLLPANKTNEDRFQLLGEKTVELHTNAAHGAPAARWGQAMKYIKWYMKLPSIPIHYSSTLGSITEVRSNNIFIAYQASSVGNTTIEAAYRTHYTDKN